MSAKNLQIVHIKNTSTHKIKKGETAFQIAKNNDITILELKLLNPNINLSNLPIGTIIITRKNKQYESRAQNLLQINNKITTTYNKNNIASLPRIPNVGYNPLPHLEHVLPVELTPTSTKYTNENTSEHHIASSSSALTKIRQIISSKKNSDRDENTHSSPSISLPTNINICDQNKIDLFWPVETRTISSTWGPRIRTKVVKIRVSSRSKRHKQVMKHFVGNHKGIDLSAPQGGSVFAAMDGQIIASSNHKHYGNFVTIDHGNKIMTLYGHCDRNFVAVGDMVRRGQKIAEVGCTGNATGPHVHFELRLDGTAQNPLPFMKDMEEASTTIIAKN